MTINTALCLVFANIFQSTLGLHLYHAVLTGIYSCLGCCHNNRKIVYFALALPQRTESMVLGSRGFV
jgi:hypothetical protein